MPITGITIEADSVVIKGSDFDALCGLAAENERLRKQLSSRLQDLERIKQERLNWGMVCDHDCPACTALDDAIRGDPPVPHP